MSVKVCENVLEMLFAKPRFSKRVAHLQQTATLFFLLQLNHLLPS